MLSLQRRARRAPDHLPPLPTVPAVVLAILVALAATVADGVGAVDPTLAGRSATRVTLPLAASGRVLASALSSVAERLENDWAGGARRATSGGSANFANADRAIDAGALPRMSACGRVAIDVGTGGTLGQSRYLRRVGNLPPPAATVGA